MSTAASSRSSTASDSADDEYDCPDFVRMLLLNEDIGAVLMVLEDGDWDLPYFAYPKSLSYDMHRCCRDLQRFLGIESDDICFTVAVDLFGVRGSFGKHEPKDGELGYARLMKVESRIDAFELPASAAWKDADFVSSLFSALQVESQSLQRRSSSAMRNRTRSDILEVTLTCMQPGNSILASLHDPRYQRGWFSKAAEFLVSAVRSVGAEVSGNVIQRHVCPTSTMLMVQSTEGQFYLKSPALGSNEVSITSTIASLFPESTLDVVATCDELRCFVSKEFNHARIRDSDVGEMVQKLGRMQLDSVECLDKLRDGGLPDHGPERLGAKIQGWIDDVGETPKLGFRLQQVTKRAPKLVDICAQLSRYNIPLTLVHGDFADRNVAFAGGNESDMILFDWQYACIGHPFCDFHELGDDIAEEELEKYLRMWSSFESMERVREAYNLGRRLGWCLKMWSVQDCVEQCDPQRASSMVLFMFECFGHSSWDLDMPSGCCEEHD